MRHSMEHTGIHPCGNSTRKARSCPCSGAGIVQLVAWFLAVMLLCGLGCDASSVCAQPPTNPKPGGAWTLLPTDVPIQLNADRLSYNHKNSEYLASGNVRVTVSNARLQADSVLYNEKTRELTARGKVILRRGSDVIEADKFLIRFPNATAVIYNGKLKLTGRNIYLDGEKLEKVEDSHYRIKRGGLHHVRRPDP